MTTYLNFKKTTWTISLLGILLLFGQKAFAEQELPEGGIFDLWSYQQVIDVKLTFDLDEVFEDRRGEEKYPAHISFKDESGAKQNWQLKVSTRGNFRRQKCNEMPPLKLNFKKGDLRDAGLADFDDFKLVTHCIDDFQEAKELLLKEFLIYRMFNQLTDISYRVQLVNITYEDVNTGQRKKQMGFLIEDSAQLRARIDADKVEDMRIIDQEKYDAEYAKLVSLFQYMIGNADWGITHSKNIKYVEKDQKVWPVPYDFDFAGLVDAPYMIPSSRYGQTNRFDRIYLGFERSKSELESTLRLFEERKEKIYQTVHELKILKRAAREDMIAYLDTFFVNAGEMAFTEDMD